MSEKDELKTGTTTVGIICEDSVILGADKRATAGNMVVHKEVDKVIPVGDRMAVTTAGSVSDIQKLLRIIKAELKLKNIRSKRGSTVKEAASLLSNMVYRNVRQLFPSVSHFLFGGVEEEPELYDIFPGGSITRIDDFVASGSGSVFAYGVLETNYEENMSKEEGVELAKKAIMAALERDSASGNGIDIYSIDKDGLHEEFSKMLETKVE